MTSFVHLDYSTQHAGVARIESAIDAARQIKQNASGTRLLATLLVSAVAAAAMVVAYQVMDSMAEGHLLALWVCLWLVAFATLAAFAGTARRAVVKLQAGLDAWSRGIAAKRSDERLWAAAKADPRIMADLQCAIAHSTLDLQPLKPRLSAVEPKSARTDWINSAALRYGQQIPFV